MIMKYLTSSLEKAIMTGGMIITPRKAGKTEAIANILSKRDDFIVICFSNDSADLLIKTVLEKNTKTLSEIKQLVIKSSPVLSKSNKLFNCNKKLIIDEFLINETFYDTSIEKRIHCLIGSPIMDLVVYDHKGKRQTLKKDKCLELKSNKK